VRRYKKGWTCLRPEKGARNILHRLQRRNLQDSKMKIKGKGEDDAITSPASETTD